MKKQRSQILFITGGTLTIIGAVAQLFTIFYAPYIFSVGVAMIIYTQAKNALDSWTLELRQQRLARMGFLSSLLLGLAAYFMFTSSNAWVVAVLIYALSSLFLSFRGN